MRYFILSSHNFKQINICQSRPELLAGEAPAAELAPAVELLAGQPPAAELIRVGGHLAGGGVSVRVAGI